MIFLNFLVKISENLNRIERFENQPPAYLPYRILRNSQLYLLWEKSKYLFFFKQMNRIFVHRLLCTSHLYPRFSPSPPHLHVTPPNYGDGREQRLSQNQSSAEIFALWGQMSSNSPAIRSNQILVILEMKTLHGNHYLFNNKVTFFYLQENSA